MPYKGNPLLGISAQGRYDACNHIFNHIFKMSFWRISNPEQGEWLAPEEGPTGHLYTIFDLTLVSEARWIWTFPRRKNYAQSRDIYMSVRIL